MMIYSYGMLIFSKCNGVSIPEEHSSAPKIEEVNVTFLNPHPISFGDFDNIARGACRAQGASNPSTRGNITEYSRKHY